MLGKLLAGGETEEDGLEMLVLVNRPAERAVRGQVDFAREVGNDLKCVFHGSVLADALGFNGDDRDGREVLFVFSKYPTH